ncbi:MAG: D-alanine--D-alanine ligase [Chloroflexota bacterium]
MYICVLTSIPEENDPPYDPSPHMNGYKWKHYLVHPRNVDRQLQSLMDEGVEVFINLCDGTPDDALSGIGLVKAMEKLGAAFTGADSAFFDPTRQQMKAAARKSGVPAPASVFIDSLEDVDKAVRRLKFPMLTKPPHGYASIGITRASRVQNADELRTQVEISLKEFGRVLVEEFIEGREFTCLVAENPEDPEHPITFKPVEFIFPQGESFKHYDMKWVDYEKMSVAAVSDPRIEQVLRDQTVRMFKTLEGNGYARCDYRMDSTGTIYMLEINPNCGIFYSPTEPGSADFSLLNDPVYSHPKFLKLIIRGAKKRQAQTLLKRREKVKEKEMAYA